MGFGWKPETWHTSYRQPDHRLGPLDSQALGLTAKDMKDIQTRTNIVFKVQICTSAQIEISSYFWKSVTQIFFFPLAPYPQCEGGRYDFIRQKERKGATLTLSLEMSLPCIKKTQEEAGTCVTEEPMYSFLIASELIEWSVSSLDLISILWR
jgi:hypothetical protein